MPEDLRSYYKLCSYKKKHVYVLSWVDLYINENKLLIQRHNIYSFDFPITVFFRINALVWINAPLK